MKNILVKGKWSPYVAGALTGVLAIMSVYVTAKVLQKSKYLGASTTFVRVAGLIENTFASEHVASNDYFVKTKVKIDWQMLFVLGIFFGALISSLLGKSFKLENVPSIWKERFGNNALLRGVLAFIGGMIALFGVRLASGCPSGHGLSGMMQLSVSGVLAMVGFMAGGIVTAGLLYKGGK